MQLEALPDTVLDPVISFLDLKSLAHLSYTCIRFRNLLRPAHVWTTLIRRDFSIVDQPYLRSNPRLESLSERRLYETWATVQSRWRNWPVLHSGGGPVARLQLSSGAVFCVNRAGGSPDGRSYYVTGGSDGVVRVVQRRDAPGLYPVHVVAEQPLPTDGIMGMSVDPHAGTMVTGSTSGIVGSWRLHHQEVTRLDSLPVSQLKALLKQRSIPIDDLREKQELVSRIRLLNAAPLLTPLARFREHAGSNVIGAAHAGDVAVTGDDGGEAYVWSTSTGARLHALPHPQGEGVDATGVDVPAGRAFTGCKDGSTRAWDLETGAKVFEWNRAAGRGRWVWVVKSGSSSFAGEGPFSGASSPVFPDILFSAGTDGYVRLFDLRDSRLAQSVKATRSEDAEQQMLFPGGFHSVPITAVVPQLAHNRFITAGFDGCVRVFDFRKFEATQTIRAATDVRLSRADADHDTIMVGAASDGSVRMIPFDV